MLQIRNIGELPLVKPSSTILQVITSRVESILVSDFFACRCFGLKVRRQLSRSWRLTPSWWPSLVGGRNEMVSILRYLSCQARTSSPKSREVLSKNFATILHSIRESLICVSSDTWWDAFYYQGIRRWQALNLTWTVLMEIRWDQQSNQDEDSFRLILVENSIIGFVVKSI